jgi:hypothetical protein
MPAPSRRCSATTATGESCRAWAVRGSDPPLCSIHSGRAKGGAPPGSDKPNTKHGFYSSALDPTELADLVTFSDDMTLADEIAVCRVVLRRLLSILENPPGPDRDACPEQACPEQRDRACPERSDRSDRITDYAKLAGLSLQAARTIARLLRDQRALSGKAADGIVAAIAQALDELSTEWGVQL